MLETNNFIIYFKHNEDFIEKLANDLENNLKLVLEFFEIQRLNIKIVVNILSNKNDFESSFYNVHNFYPDLNAIGFYHDSKITYLSFTELNKTNHKNESYESYVNILIHECVHFLHGYITNDKMSLRCFNEGIALFLGNQYDFVDYNKFNCSLDDLLNQKNIDYYNYYLIVNYLIENKPKKEVLNLLKNKDIAINELNNIYGELLKIKEKNK